MTNSSIPPIKVLIADDEVEFASTLVTRLQLRKFDATMATSGQAALDSVAQEHPDVLVLDLKMPDLDGLEVLAQLQELEPNTKVIILTGHGSFEVGLEGMKLGAFDYLMKPINLNLLIDKIEQAFASSSSSALPATKKDHAKQ